MSPTAIAIVFKSTCLLYLLMLDDGGDCDDDGNDSDNDSDNGNDDNVVV